VKAYVVLAPGFTPSMSSLKISRIREAPDSPYKYPREIEFITELPKTISGKIKRAVLRNKEIEKKLGRPGGGMGVPKV